MESRTICRFMRVVSFRYLTSIDVRRPIAFPTQLAQQPARSGFSPFSNQLRKRRARGVGAQRPSLRERAVVLLDEGTPALGDLV
jgi:hypothetical protein